MKMSASKLDIALLKKKLEGAVITPVSSEYSVAKQVWNHAFEKNPEVIAKCVCRDDVIRTLEFARQNQLEIAVRAGGHSFAGFGVSEGGVVIDLSGMKTVNILPRSGTVTIEPGIIGGELDCITQAFKTALPLGSCPSVGVAGYALGGGEGSLTPKLGYGCDSLLNVEIVTADGRLLTANKDENSDLFWALCGAGANFGVAVSLTFRLHAIEKVLSGHLKYPIHDASNVLGFIKDYAPTIPDEMFLLVAVLPCPGERMLDIGIVWPGEPSEGLRALRPLRTFIKPFEDTIEVRDYLDEQRAGFESPEEGVFCSRRRSGHLSNLTSTNIDVIVDHVSNAPSEECGINLVYWHGPWSSQPHDNSFGFRRVGFEYWIHSYWRPEDRDRSGRNWVDHFYADLAPLSTGAVYVNGLENEGEARARASYGDKYDRLRLLKRKFDPENLFRLNQNIEPATD